MNRRVILLAGLAAVLAGCATRPPVIAAPAGSPLEELEPLFLVRAGPVGLTIEVSSNGCTTKADFAHHVERRGEATTIAFGRRRVDTCKSFAQGKATLDFGYEELGLGERGGTIFVLNPLQPWRGPGL